MGISSKIKYKIAKVTYGKKKINFKSISIGKTLSDIDSVLDDVVKVVTTNKSSKNNKK